MKIGIDISQAQYLGTGVGTYTYQLVKHLLVLPNPHHFVLFGASMRGIGTLKALFEPLVKPPHQLKLFPLPPSFVEPMFNKYRFIPIDWLIGDTDVFHASDWTQPLTRAKKITTIHDLTIYKFPQFLHSNIVASHRRRLHWVKQEADSVLVDAQATKIDVTKILNIPESKINVVYLAASPDFNAFAQLDRPARSKKIQAVKQKYKLDRYVLSVGTSEPRKNLERVIKAFADIPQSTQAPLTLAIVGRFGWGKKLKAQEHINLLGFVDQSDLPALYAGAQAFVYASLYEGFGLPVLEAMTVGVPVVTTQRGSLAEVAGQAAELVNPYSQTSIAQGIHNVLQDGARFRQLGKKQASLFSWEKTAKSTLAQYESLQNNS